jgi:hypothetical protein
LSYLFQKLHFGFFKLLINIDFNLLKSVRHILHTHFQIVQHSVMNKLKLRQAILELIGGLFRLPRMLPQQPQQVLQRYCPVVWVTDLADRAEQPVFRALTLYAHIIEDLPLMLPALGACEVLDALGRLDSDCEGLGSCGEGCCLHWWGGLL